MNRPQNRICSLDSTAAPVMLNQQTGTEDFTYSPLDTPATASGGVIYF
jgi:hypothetical protein